MLWQECAKEENGKFWPKCSKKSFVKNLILDLSLIAVTILAIYEILSFPDIDLKILIPSIILIPILDYLMLISPYQQYIEKYHIEFVNESKLDGFKLFYKKKELKILYEIDDEGKLLFKEKNKLNCITYNDGSRMSNLTKRRILNYFTKWLSDNNLISEKY